MSQASDSSKNRRRVFFNHLKSFFGKPQNTILVIMAIICTITTFAPIVAIVEDTLKIHVGSIDQYLTGKTEGFTLINYIDLFTSRMAKTNLWTPLFNTVVMSVLSCLVAILYGGFFAFLVTRTNLRFKKYLSSIFIFPYIMPQWTLAMVWKNLFDSNIMTGTRDYAPFAYILIGGIFRNMDANLEEAATILNTPRAKIMTRVTLPLVRPAILSTILLVFGSSMGSYPVPHYLNFTTLSTKYLEMNVKYAGEASILAVIMMVLGVAIMILNQRSLKSRKSYTTVTGKSGQTSKINLGRAGRTVIACVFVVLTFLTSIFPIISFAFETFLPNPGDYSFLYTWNPGQMGLLYNPTIWNAFKGTVLVSVACALIAGTLGTLIGYAVSKNRRSKLAGYVNSVAFLPYLMPSVAVGIAFFILLTGEKLNLYNTYWILIIVGTIKYIPFASRSSLNSILQISGEIEESAIMQDIPWWKRMVRIIIPIQKSSIVSGYLLPFMTCLRELSLFLVLCTQGFILSTTLDYFDEMGLYAFSSGINLILIVTILVSNAVINKITGASLDEGIGS